MIFAKFIAPIALLLAVSASSWESACRLRNKVMLISNNGYQSGICMTVPFGAVKDQWGGGKSGCNDGTSEVYWKLSSVGSEAWICYGHLDDCRPLKASLDDSLVVKNDYDICWSIKV
ncbi:hypothetical protein BGX24_000820 [Mortierella sp. AD032]|nr:hypothetical protein BGX24_000820 [Mortierella sp. AD032]